jgi:hypothetical protein
VDQDQAVVLGQVGQRRERHGKFGTTDTNTQNHPKRDR